MKIKTRIKAGGVSLNHSETLIRDQAGKIGQLLALRLSSNSKFFYNIRIAGWI